jgi:hypothetical protein
MDRRATTRIRVRKMEKGNRGKFGKENLRRKINGRRAKERKKNR